MISLSRFPKGSFERLEPYEGKLSCTVLRGGSGSNAGVLPDQIIDQLVEVYTPWIDAAISNYNTDFYYPPRGYLWVCYEEGQICA